MLEFLNRLLRRNKEKKHTYTYNMDYGSRIIAINFSNN